MVDIGRAAAHPRGADQRGRIGLSEAATENPAASARGAIAWPSFAKAAAN